MWIKEKDRKELCVGTPRSAFQLAPGFILSQLSDGKNSPPFLEQPSLFQSQGTLFTALGEEGKAGLHSRVQTRKLRLEARGSRRKQSSDVTCSEPPRELWRRRRAPSLCPPAPAREHSLHSGMKGERVINGRSTREPVRMWISFQVERSSKWLRESMPRKIKQPFPPRNDRTHILLAFLIDFIVTAFP